MFGIKMPWTRRREALLARARAEREAERKKEDDERKRRMEAARKEHERYTTLLIERERARALRAEKEARELRYAQETVSRHDLFGNPTPAIEYPRWRHAEPASVSREWDSTAPEVFKAGGGTFDGGGASGDWSRSDSSSSCSSSSSSSDSGSSSSDSGSSGGCD